MSLLRKWEYPKNYFGATWYDYYVFLGQSRESEAWERSNFTCGLNKLGGESDTVIVVREKHWAVGWVESILIHESNIEAQKIAETILQKLEDYPLVNEDHFCELEALENEEIE
jgi:hypothetical protein